ncbi:hypothetical protein [Heyndrickxia sporothermodurans]
MKDAEREANAEQYAAIDAERRAMSYERDALRAAMAEDDKKRHAAPVAAVARAIVNAFGPEGAKRLSSQLDAIKARLTELPLAILTVIGDDADKRRAAEQTATAQAGREQAEKDKGARSRAARHRELDEGAL